MELNFQSEHTRKAKNPKKKVININPQNEIARSVRNLIERIDYTLENEHLDYKKGEELRKKRDAYSEYLKALVPTLQGVDY